MINWDTEEADSISSDANISDGTSSYEETFPPSKLEDELSLLKMPSEIEASEIFWSTKSFSRQSSVDGLMPLDGEDNKSPSTTKTTSKFEEKFFNSNLGKVHVKSNNEKTHSKSASDASHETFLGASSFRTADKSSELNTPSRNEIHKTRSLEKLSKITDKGSPDRAMPFSNRKKNDRLPFNLSCRPMDKYYDDYEDLNRCCEKKNSLSSKENLKISSKSNTSNRQIGKSEDREPRPLSNVEDEYSRSHIEKRVSICEPTYGSMEPESKRVQTAMFPFPMHFSKRLSLKMTSFDGQADNVFTEPATPSPGCDSSSSLSTCSGMGDYYHNDEDLQRFCENDKSANSTKALNNENLDPPTLDSPVCNATSDRNCETPACQIILKEAESTNSLNSPIASFVNTSLLNEENLLMQIRQFSDNPVDDNKIMRWQECVNNIIASRYFTDEFAQQHGLTAIVNEVEIIRNELDDTTDERVTSQSRSLDSYLRRLGETLEMRPFSILITLLKFYLLLYNTYSY